MNARDIFDLEQVRLSEHDGVVTLAHYLIDDVYTKVFVALKAGTFVGQHSHAYEHGTLVAAGAIRVFLDGKWKGDFKAGEMITIKAERKHVLLALEDNTVAACIHNVHGETEPEVAEEMTLEDMKCHSA